jgi:beta-lactamase class A
VLIQKNWQKYLIYALIFSSGIFFGYLLNPCENLSEEEVIKNSEVNFKENFPHINPLKFCDSSDKNPINGKISQMEKAVNDLINNSGIEAAVYYRNLNNGPWFMINKDEIFYAQSLLKVPVAITYYHLAEQNPSLLQSTISYQGQHEEIRNIPKDDSIQSGQDYSIEELIVQMLVYSDNQALHLLFDYLNMLGLSQKLEETNREISVESENGEINIKKYSEMMRILYNSTYLNRESSERILSILTHTSFKNGLVAGFPEGTEISHKFGVKENSEENEEAQLHDCGIIYLSTGEHLICVMTKGKNTQEQSSLIKKIARTIAQEIMDENTKSKQ